MSRHGGTALVLWILLVIAAVLAVLVIRVYNRLIALRNRFRNGFAQIDVQLKRRYDLIPNLVETAKGYMKHERETLEAVINARNQAMSAEGKAAANPLDAAAIQGLIGAEAVLGGMLTRFFALVESYPDLKADRTMTQLAEELVSTENRIAFARQAYNDAVTVYNTAREVFPSNLVADAFSFEPGTLLLIEEPEERQVQRVAFD